MSIGRKIKHALRPVRNVLWALFGFGYDFSRYARYGGWRGRGDIRKRDYKAVKTYHRLEKSLSFRQRRRGSGWDAAGDLTYLLGAADLGAAAWGYHETVGIKVLRDFVACSDGGGQTADRVGAFLQGVSESSREGGVIELSAEQLLAGRLEEPERFFLSRHSVRDFRPRSGAARPVVSCDTAGHENAVGMQPPGLACLSPGAARQYRSRIDVAKRERRLWPRSAVPADHHRGPERLRHAWRALSALDRRRHVRDGAGAGVALARPGCVLPRLESRTGDDLHLRKLVALDGAHTVIMMMAVGYPSEHLKVCYSARRPLDSIITHMDGQT